MVAEQIGPPTPVQWSSERIALLAKLWVSGASTSDMAKALGVTRSAVVGRVKGLRVDLVRPSFASSC